MHAISRRRILLAFVLLGFAKPTPAGDTVAVFAAASLKDARDEAAKAFQAKTGVEVKARWICGDAG